MTAVQACQPGVSKSLAPGRDKASTAAHVFTDDIPGQACRQQQNYRGPAGIFRQPSPSRGPLPQCQALSFGEVLCFMSTIMVYKWVLQSTSILELKELVSSCIRLGEGSPIAFRASNSPWESTWGHPSFSINPNSCWGPVKTVLVR